MKKKIIIALVILLLVGLIFLLIKMLKKEDKNIIKTYGNIEIRTVDLSFQVSGIIEKVLVEEGDYVKKGQILAKLVDKSFLFNKVSHSCFEIVPSLHNGKFLLYLSSSSRACA